MAADVRCVATTSQNPSAGIYSILNINVNHYFFSADGNLFVLILMQLYRGRCYVFRVLCMLLRIVNNRCVYAFITLLIIRNI